MVSKNGIQKALTAPTSTTAYADEGFKTKAYAVAVRHPTPRDAKIEWRCVGADPTLFDPETVEQLDAAKSYCGGCPARFLCLNLGLDRGEWGVWGGVLLEGGKRLDAPRQPGRPKKVPDVVVEQEDAVALG